MPARHLTQQGWSQRQMAEALGVSEGAVSQWMTRGREGGLQALHHRSPRGAPRRWSAEPLAQLPGLRQRGPDTYGVRGHLWTRGRMAAILQRAIGVSSHPRHVGRGCQALRWRPQQPPRRARQRDEAAMAQGREPAWPALKQGRRPSRARASS